MLNAKRQRALACLLTCRTQEEAAAAAGCTPKTIREYLKEEEFAAEYRRRYDELFEDAARSAEKYINPALQILWAICENEGSPPTARVSAAVNLIRCGRELRETGDIIRRIGALEDEQSKNRNTP